MVALPLSILLTVAPSPELLTKIAARSEASAHFLDDARAVLEMQEVEYNTDRSVRTSKTSTVQVTRRGGVIEEETVLSLVINGKNATQEERQALVEKRRKSASAKSGPPLPFPLPFLESEAGKYQFEILSPPASHPEWVLLGFTPRDKDEAKLFQGQALVDPETGDIISMHVSPTKKLFFLQQMSVDVNFETMTPLGRAISRLAVKVAITIPFLSKNLAATFRVLEYQPVPP